MMIDFDQSFIYRLCQIAEKFHEKNAIFISGNFYTYGQLFLMSKNIAYQLIPIKTQQVAILMKPSVYQYAAMIGSWLAGKAYVPLNINDSTEKIKEKIIFSEAGILLIDEDHDVVSKNNLEAISEPLRLLVITKDSMKFCGYQPPLLVIDRAYLMFTSGTTGAAKAVMITHHQLSIFIDNILGCCPIKPTDHCSQISELTFDFSIYEVFSCFSAGACLYVFCEKMFFSLPQFIVQHEITCWSCVPSVVTLLSQLKMLSKDNFLSIRYSIFCGECLTSSVAKFWQSLAPNSRIYNLYGPTEATVAITCYQWPLEDSRYDVVPIGWPFAHQKIRVVDDHNVDVDHFVVGELLLSGSQVITKYWKNNFDDLHKFFINQGISWYKTGDLVYVDPKLGLIFKGRRDEQFKIQGYRIEKIDIENQIKKIADTDLVAVIACKQSDEVAWFYAYVVSDQFTEMSLMKKCRMLMPSYMLPKEIMMVSSLPYNKNKKIDYKNLISCKKQVSGFIDLEIYDKSRKKNIKIAVWYPTHKLPKEHCYFSHYLGFVAEGADFPDKPCPLLVISHGQLGHRFNQCYLGEFMAAQGYIVAAVEHPSDTTFNETVLPYHENLIQRAKDIQFSLDYLLSSDATLAMIDDQKIGGIGHSMGGATLTILAGGLATNNQLFVEENLVDRRFKAMMLLAPVKSDFFSEDSMKNIILPALIVFSGKDELLPCNEIFYINCWPDRKILEFPDAGHFVYLMECPDAIKNQCPDICIDPGTSRLDVHPILQHHALRFFNESFK